MAGKRQENGCAMFIGTKKQQLPHRLDCTVQIQFSPAAAAAVLLQKLASAGSVM
jgi:hypothetical protein